MEDVFTRLEDVLSPDVGIKLKTEEVHNQFSKLLEGNHEDVLCVNAFRSL